MSEHSSLFHHSTTIFPQFVQQNMKSGPMNKSHLGMIIKTSLSDVPLITGSINSIALQDYSIRSPVHT